MKKKLLFLFQSENNWLNLQTLFEVSLNHSDLDPQVVKVPTSKIGDYSQLPTSDYLDKMGIKCLDGRDPNLLHQQSFDGVIYSLPYDHVRPPHLRSSELKKNIRHLFYIPYALDIDVGYADILDRFNANSLALATTIFARSKYVKDDFKKYAQDQGHNVLVTGLPRFDLLRQIDSFSPNPELSSLVKGRPCILINHHHSVGLHGVSTFDQWGIPLLLSMQARPEIATIWRPHPGLWATLKNMGLIRNYEIILFKEQLTQGGIIIDESDDYRHAFVLSDACISDGSSFLLDYLFTNKPMLFQQALRDERFISSEAQTLLSGYDQSTNLKDTLLFIDRVVQKQAAPPRVNINEFLFGIDGKSTQRVFEHIQRTVSLSI